MRTYLALVVECHVVQPQWQAEMLLDSFSIPPLLAPTNSFFVA